ncbi:hypothetical protein CIG11343_0182 [Campylobacter iguaniorum]|uniref:Uncharacterized protein n=1 Tax=Campylobacter iguaniorum TaxID=1244531 RepID=A0A076F9C3_9BACT|nr:hypothetical protein [Campylobacter iguaniorum]AII14102.1 hypothetical protein CIG1485E_0231 [Campylobacter iguaniorum]ALV23841.1 hypothetical protein CIG2463D_0236 [Campylobacter iguaniorum]ANE35272.1 hypothetical protein CIG11343_0182 [Campylobacter iguaniorum]
MVDFRLIASRVLVQFQKDLNGEFELEFSQSRSSIDEWLSLEKARGESANSDPLTVKLLVELYKKVDELSNLIKNEKSPQIPLESLETATHIGFEGFKFGVQCLEEGEIYFARILLPTFIKKEILVYFRALDTNTAKIFRVSKGDEREWSAYVAESERLEIRRAKNDEQ